MNFNNIIISSTAEGESKWTLINYYSTASLNLKLSVLVAYDGLKTKLQLFHLGACGLFFYFNIWTTFIQL